MAWFKSRQQPGGNQQMDYLNATDTTVRPLALPSLLVALLLVCAIAFLLFVIGRWGYQELSKSDAPTSSEVTSTDGSGNASTDSATGDSNSGQGTDTSGGQGGSNNGDTSSSADSSASSSNTAGTTGSDNSSASTSTNSSSANTAIQTDSIPNTGPSSLVGVFAVTVVLSSASYYIVTVRSIKRSV